MAENVKRRIAAARLAVAFVAAGTVTGAAAWAQASPASPMAKQSILVSSNKSKVDSSDIKNGSLLLQDFKAGEVASQDDFFKYKSQVSDWKSNVKGEVADIKGESNSIKGEVSDIKGELGGVESQIGDIKGAQAGYIKASEADTRYLKLDASVVEGDGSVFTATQALKKGAPAVTLLDVPKLITVAATDSTIRVTNNSGSPLTHSDCTGVPAGELASGDTLSCSGGETAQTLQLISGGQVSTLNFTTIQVPGSLTQATVQILIGL